MVFRATLKGVGGLGCRGIVEFSQDAAFGIAEVRAKSAAWGISFDIVHVHESCGFPKAVRALSNQQLNARSVYLKPETAMFLHLSTAILKLFEEAQTYVGYRGIVHCPTGRIAGCSFCFVDVFRIVLSLSCWTKVVVVSLFILSLGDVRAKWL